MWKVKYNQALCLVFFLGGIDNAFPDQGEKSNQREALESKDFWESFDVVANTDVQIDELEALDRAGFETAPSAEQEKTSDAAKVASNSSATNTEKNKTEKSKSDHATKNTMSERIK